MLTISTSIKIYVTVAAAYARPTAHHGVPCSNTPYPPPHSSSQKYPTTASITTLFRPTQKQTLLPTLLDIMVSPMAAHRRTPPRHLLSSMIREEGSINTDRAHIQRGQGLFNTTSALMSTVYPNPSRAGARPPSSQQTSRPSLIIRRPSSGRSTPRPIPQHFTF